MEEKVNLTAGITADSSCSGIIPAIPRVGFPGLCVTDAGNGVVCWALAWIFLPLLTLSREVRTLSMLGQVGYMLVQGISHLPIDMCM